MSPNLYLILSLLAVAFVCFLLFLWISQAQNAVNPRCEGCAHLGSWRCNAPEREFDDPHLECLYGQCARDLSVRVEKK